MTIIRFRRGNKADLPASAPGGMPLWCEDTKELFIGTDDNVAPVSKNDINLVPYSVNSGKKNVEGYADFITKDNDTQVTINSTDFTCTYPDGTVEALSENITINELHSDGIYTFIKEKDVNPYWVKIGYIGAVNLLASGCSASAFSTFANYYPSKAIDGSTATYDGWVPADGNTSGWWKVTLPNAKSIRAYEIAPFTYMPTSMPKSWTFEGSNDNSNWTILDTVTGHTGKLVGTFYRFTFENSTAYKYYRLNMTSSNGHSYIALGEVRMYEGFTGGTITEDIVLPTSPQAGDYYVDTSVRPLRQYKYNGTDWQYIQFVKLGKVTKTSGVLGTPESFSFNSFFIGSNGLESEIGSESITVDTNEGNKLVKRVF